MSASPKPSAPENVNVAVFFTRYRWSRTPTGSMSPPRKIPKLIIVVPGGPTTAGVKPLGERRLLPAVPIPKPRPGAAAGSRVRNCHEASPDLIATRSLTTPPMAVKVCGT